jgi:hypothetical protein
LMLAAMTALPTPAAAEPLDPRYPVCMQKWEWGGISRIYCSFLTWDDCEVTARGLSAMCLTNPYWSAGPARPAVTSRTRPAR